MTTARGQHRHPPETPAFNASRLECHESVDMSDVSNDELEPGVLILAKDALIKRLQKPLSVVTSKTAQKAYLSTILAILTASILLFTAAIAYVAFYFSYVPDRGISRPIYLQFGPSHPPYGYASIQGALISQQPYDVKVILHMPRTPNNKAAGNFMIDLQLIAPGSTSDGVVDDKNKVLAKSSRPAILNYKSATMELVQQGFSLPWHLIGWREEAEVLKVPMIESVEFPKGWRNIPDHVRLELRSDEKLQVYSAKIEITARLRGLRYLMYSFRITSFIILTGMFWTVELIVTTIVWLSLSTYLTSMSSRGAESKKEDTWSTKHEPQIKDEPEISDTPHTFPTLTGQPPLHYASPQVKQEKEEEEEENLPAEHQTHAGEQADDEDDDGGRAQEIRGYTDSGIGTSMESTGPKSTIRRRRSHMDGE
ncbi:uncharacterized protein PV09_01327 [Verruconis gallopava]|uniref:Seipin n=1 Tax=Verruconis gallopava TaxID=253628 RepID=A0A0D2AP12_9PEZI|nr:uncharacterized protein PV09_01327 [Verruconis gallopava]KIW08423.1 hypothetical protein PV09_01327 [Verruconis gallopava]